MSQFLFLVLSQFFYVSITLEGGGSPKCPNVYCFLRLPWCLIVLYMYLMNSRPWQPIQQNTQHFITNVPQYRFTTSRECSESTVESWNQRSRTQRLLNTNTEIMARGRSRRRGGKQRFAKIMHEEYWILKVIIVT